MIEKRNIVFIMTDHQRADSIGMIQDGKEVTPNLNKMAKDATRFTRAYNTCPLCIPARTALATGKAPIANGVVFNDIKGKTAGDHKTIHQYLDEAGFEVAHVGVHHIRVNPSLEERVNFDLWISEDEYEVFANENGVNTKRSDLDRKLIRERQENDIVDHYYSNSRASVFPHDNQYFKDIFFCDKAVEFLKEKNDKPFALFLYLWAPHPPLIVPEPYASKFNKENIVLPANVGVTAKDEPALRRKGAAAQIAEGISLEEWKKAWAAHLGLVNLADDCVGRILDALKESGEDENTVVMFTSDHGEHLGQHSMYQKMEMYEQAIRVPMLIKTPEGNNQVVNSPISHLDLMPTLLDFAGIESEEELDGDSLKECVVNNENIKEKDVFSQYSGNPRVGDIRRTVISGKYKYIYDPDDSAELFDLEEDPLEMKNIANNPQMKKIVDEMHVKCQMWGKNQRDWIKY